MIKTWAQIPSNLSSRSYRQLDTVLQQSRLAAVTEPITKKPLFHPRPEEFQLKQKKSHPTHQVISTTPAARFRQNWGLKNTLPQKQHSPYVTVDALDRNGLTDFNSGSTFPLISKRIKELQTHVNPLISQNKSLGRADIFSSGLLDKESSNTTESGLNKERLANHIASLGFNQKAVDSITSNQTFLDVISGKDNSKAYGSLSRSQVIHGQARSHTQESSYRSPPSLARPIATAGLSYSLQGSMGNRPSKFLLSARPTTPKSDSEIIKELNDTLPSTSLKYPVIRGRFVSERGTLAAIAGVTASSNLVSLNHVKTREIVHEAMQPFSVRSINMREDGTVSVNVEAHTRSPRDTRPSYGLNNHFPSIKANLRLSSSNSGGVSRSRARVQSLSDDM